MISKLSGAVLERLERADYGGLNQTGEHTYKMTHFAGVAGFSC